MRHAARSTPTQGKSDARTRVIRVAGTTRGRAGNLISGGVLGGCKACEQECGQQQMAWSTEDRQVWRAWIRSAHSSRGYGCTTT